MLLFRPNIAKKWFSLIRKENRLVTIVQSQKRLLVPKDIDLDWNWAGDDGSTIDGDRRTWDGDSQISYKFINKSIFVKEL